jgi:PAS domain S-box-containing protein
MDEREVPKGLNVAKEKIKCWEFFQCNEVECPVFKTKEVMCWLISGTHCRNEIQGKFLEKMEMCLECEPFKANMDKSSIEATLKVINRQFAEFRGMVEERDRELEGISMELALGLSEVFEALKEISSGDPLVRIPETSELELISKLKHLVNITAENLGEIVDLSHEFAIGLAEHFDILHRVSRGDLTARVTGTSQLQLLESLKEVTNETIGSVFKAMSECKIAQEELRESEERYRTVLEACPDPLVVYDMKGKVIYINPVFTRVFGWTLEELSGSKIDYVPEENWPETKMMIEKVLAGESFSGVESRRYNKEGNILSVSISAAIYLNHEKVPWGSVHILRDISEQKQAEKALQESEEKYKTLVENSLTGVFIRQDGKYVFINDRFAEIHGYAHKELLGKEAASLIHPDEREALKQRALARLQGEDVPQHYESRRIRKDGSTFWCEMIATHIEYGERPAIMGNIIDITERKQAEQVLLEARNGLERRVKERTTELTEANEQLKHEIEERKRAEKEVKLSEEKYRLLFSNDPNALFLVDGDSGRILDVNNAATMTYQYGREELLQMDFLDLFDADEAREVQSELSDFHRDVYIFLPRISAKKKDGRSLFIHLHAGAVQFEKQGREQLGRALIIRTVDITRRLEQEAMIAQAGKMATLGEMATGVAHELNQPLNVIQVGTDLLAKTINRGRELSHDELLKLSRNISEQVERATSIVDHLREFGRKSYLDVYPLDINEPIQNVFTLLGQQLSLRNIKVDLKLAPNLPHILAEKNRLEQVFLNLVTNARDAMEAKGPEAGKELVIASYEEGSRVVATVSDTGKGMEEVIRKKIFDPFFTTKEAGKGTGLGLSIAYNLVKDFRGEISVKSTPEVGTTFTLSFPVHHEEGDLGDKVTRNR